jgi:hypothetical protein
MQLCIYMLYAAGGVVLVVAMVRAVRGHRLRKRPGLWDHGCHAWLRRL